MGPETKIYTLPPRVPMSRTKNLLFFSLLLFALARRLTVLLLLTAVTAEGRTLVATKSAQVFPLCVYMM